MNKTLTSNQTQQLFEILQNRFKKNTKRHPSIAWMHVQELLEKNPLQLWSLFRMEETGGEPDVISNAENRITFYDCSTQTPKGRISFCYDQDALNARKANKPKNSALNLAKEMGVEILNEKDYFFLQSIEQFDTKTSSWLLTPTEIRKQGGAIFGDFRYGRTFIYHNGAESYFSARGFRAKLVIQ